MSTKVRHTKQFLSLPIDKGPYTSDVMVVNLDKQEEASKEDLKSSKLPSLDLTLSSSKEIENEAENIFSEDFPIQKTGWLFDGKLCPNILKQSRQLKGC